MTKPAKTTKQGRRGREVSRREARRSEARRDRAGSSGILRRAPLRWIAAVPPGLWVVLLAVGLYVLHARAFLFTQDDAYISLRYARNLVEGHGLVFNPGERVEGYSNFTWTLLLALFLKLGAPAVAAATWLGVMFGAATVFVAAKFTRGLEGRWGPAAVGTALVVAGSSAFALWSTAGLETALFAFLVTAGLERGLAPGLSSRARAVGAVLLLLAALTRPDGPIVFVLWLAIRTVDTLVKPGPARAEGGIRELVRDALIIGAPLVPYALWKLSYYGDVLPNTYCAKAGLSPTYITRGIDYTLDYFHAYGVFGLAPLVAILGVIGAAFGASRGPSIRAVLGAVLLTVEARLLLVWLGFAAYIVGIGGDVLYVHRFWLAILPIGAILLARGAGTMATRFLPPRAAAPVAVAAVLALVAVPLARQWDEIQDRRQKEIGFVLNMRQTGEWLRGAFAPGSRIAITTIGAIAYYSDLHIIDMLGLTDREIARHPKLIDGLRDTWREVKYNAESVLRRRPDAILFSTGVRPSSAAEKALFLYRGFIETYRPYYFRAAPNRVNIQVLFKARDDIRTVDVSRIPVDDLEFLDPYSAAHYTLSKNADHEGAAEGFRKSMEIAGEDFPWARDWWAVARFDGGDTTAVSVLRERVAMDSTNVAVLTRLASHALRTDQFDDALALFERVTRLDPDDSFGWIGRAELMRLTGDPQSAYQFAKQSVLRWDGEPNALLLLGNLAAQFHDWGLAEWCFARGNAISPEHEGHRAGVEYVRRVRTGEVTPLPALPETTGDGGTGAP